MYVCLLLPVGYKHQKADFVLSTLHKMSNLKVGLSYSRKSPSSFSVELTISVLSDSKRVMGHGPRASSPSLSLSYVAHPTYPLTPAEGQTPGQDTGAFSCAWTQMTATR